MIAASCNQTIFRDEVSILQGMALHRSFHMPWVSLNMALLKGSLNRWRFHQVLRANKSFHPSLRFPPIIRPAIIDSNYAA
jgi:hypothetical protein